MYRRFSSECSSVRYKPRSTAVKIMTSHCFYDVAPFHTRNAWLESISIPGTGKSMPFNMLKFILYVWECVSPCPLRNWIDKTFEGSSWGFDILTSRQLTRRLSVSEEKLCCFKSGPISGCLVCSGGHCSPKWTNIIQASSALWLEWHSSSGRSEWNAGTNALKLTIRWTHWKEEVLSLIFYAYFAYFWKWH